MEAISRFAEAWLPVFATHMLEVSAFILIVWGADRMFRLPTRLRYALWLAALVKTFVPPVFSLPAPVSPASVPMAVQPLVAGLVRAVDRTSGATPAVLLFGAWIGSALILTGIVVRQNLLLRRALHSATPISNVECRVSNVECVGRSFVIRHSSFAIPFPCFSSPTVFAPILTGLFRPRLYLPEGWACWPADHLRGILAHELAHHRARDLWALLAQTVSVVLFGLNPLVWMMHTRLTHIREMRCDEAAIDQAGLHPVDYSRLLLAFVERQGIPAMPGIAGISFSEGSCTISGRFHHVLNLSPEGGRRAVWHYVAPILVGLALLPMSLRWEGTFSMSFARGVEERLTEVAQTAAVPSARAAGAVAHDVKTVGTAAVAPPRPVSPVRRAGMRSQAVRMETSAQPFAPPSVSSAVDEDDRPLPDAPEVALPREPVAPMSRAPELAAPLVLTYPEVARQAQMEGEVALQVYVTRTGEVRGVKVVGGPMMLHEAARKAAWHSVWRPAVQNGTPVDVWVALPVRFALR